MDKDKKKYDAQLRSERASEGVCARCGREPAMIGRTMCPSCLLKMRSDQAARRVRFQEAGLCRDCGHEKEPGREDIRLCIKCYCVHVASYKRMYDARLRDHMCVNCGKPLVIYEIDSMNFDRNGERYSRCPPCARRKSDVDLIRRNAIANRRNHG